MQKLDTIEFSKLANDWVKACKEGNIDPAVDEGFDFLSYLADNGYPDIAMNGKVIFADNDDEKTESDEDGYLLSEAEAEKIAEEAMNLNPDEETEAVDVYKKQGDPDGTYSYVSIRRHTEDLGWGDGFRVYIVDYCNNDIACSDIDTVPYDKAALVSKLMEVAETAKEQYDA